MIPEERRVLIVKLAKENEICTIEELSKKLQISKVTVHRDLNVLEKMGMVTKVHGGVTVESKSEFKTRFDDRLKQNYKEKLEIAIKAMEFVKDSSSIFIDASTTGFIFAKNLFKKRFFDLTVITTSPSIIHMSLNYPYIKIISTGGELNHSFNMFYGRWATDFLEKLNIDSSFISTGGVSLLKGLTSDNKNLVENLKVIFEVSGEVNVMADSSKFGKVGLLNIKPLTAVKRIITDEKISQKKLNEYRKQVGIDIVV